MDQGNPKEYNLFCVPQAEVSLFVGDEMSPGMTGHGERRESKSKWDQITKTLRFCFEGDGEHLND